MDSSESMISLVFITWNLTTCHYIYCLHSGLICYLLSPGLSFCFYSCLTKFYSQLSSRVTLWRHKLGHVTWKSSSGFHLTPKSVPASTSMISSPALLYASLERMWSTLLWILKVNRSIDWLLFSVWFLYFSIVVIKRWPYCLRIRQTDQWNRR